MVKEKEGGLATELGDRGFLGSLCRTEELGLRSGFLADYKPKS